VNEDYFIDLRSDTITKPTDEMREAAKRAIVGDDVFGDDPTVNELERYAADLFGKEAALFVSSGTQGNLVSIMSHTSPGDEVLLDSQSHIYFYEVGGLSAVAGTIPKLIESQNGYISKEVLEANLRPSDIHFAPSSLFCMENTHNRYGGVALSVDQMVEATELAKKHGLKTHLDGARIFNAAVYHKVDVKEYAKLFDSIQFCLSKGLSAPIGSMVVGDEDFIRIARKKRKMLGGGMRQAGIIAAPGLVALEKMRDRLKEDHNNAKEIGTLLIKAGFEIVPPQTNILVVYIKNKFDTVNDALNYFKSKNIGVVPFGIDKIRITTNRHIDNEIIELFQNRIVDLTEI
jgi:threonine aldolase